MSTDDSPPPFGADSEQIDESMYQSTVPALSTDVPLNDDEDEDPFGAPQPQSQQSPSAPAPAREKSLTATANTVEMFGDENQPPAQNPAANDDDDDDPFGEKSKPAPAVSTPTVMTPPPPSTPVKQETPLYPSVQQETPLYPSVENVSTPVTTTTATPPVSPPVHKRSSGDTIEITVSDPTKVGDGMSAYMTYRITTKTNLSSIFSKTEFSVNRRFSDFLGLHAKLITKYLHLGIIVPSPPEKDSLGTAKVKISKEESIPSDFIDRRRALLERFLNRLTLHEKLLNDNDVREFLEMPTELPKSKDTAALSGAGMIRAFSTISNSVTKLTMKTSEQDQWFEERHNQVVELQTHLKNAYTQFNQLLNQRKEAGHNLKQFTTVLNHLATTEEHPSLSSALTELANLQEKLEQVNNEYAYKEYSILTELIKEYISLLDMVQLAFNERIKTHQQWLNAEEALKKARERKTKLEQSPKSADKLPQAEADIHDGEAKVVKGKEDFENISKTIKEEMEAFEETRVEDFKKAIDAYLNGLLEQQERILQLWEGYLPEANKISA